MSHILPGNSGSFLSLKIKYLMGGWCNGYVTGLPHNLLVYQTRQHKTHAGNVCVHACPKSLKKDGGKRTAARPGCIISSFLSLSVSPVSTCAL